LLKLSRSNVDVTPEQNFEEINRVPPPQQFVRIGSIQLIRETDERIRQRLLSNMVEEGHVIFVYGR